MESKNLEIYNKVSITPFEARKEIQAGRLKGMTDINPMWRIKKLTEEFGACGFGWKYVITNKRLERGCNDQISCFVDVDLFIKVNDVWSEAIQGTGGSSFVAAERNGLYQNDECFKMALTDALGIACKALGFSSDIYFTKDRTKHDVQGNEPQAPTPTPAAKPETVWLSEEQFNKTILSDIKGIESVLKVFNGKNGKAMKKEYKEKLEAKIKELTK